MLTSMVCCQMATIIPGVGGCSLFCLGNPKCLELIMATEHAFIFSICSTSVSQTQTDDGRKTAWRKASDDSEALGNKAAASG